MPQSGAAPEESTLYHPACRQQHYLKGDRGRIWYMLVSFDTQTEPGGQNPMAATYLWALQSRDQWLQDRHVGKFGMQASLLSKKFMVSEWVSRAKLD